MAEYSSDEERFSAFVNFFKDHKNTLLIGFLFLTSILVQDHSSSRHWKTQEHWC